MVKRQDQILVVTPGNRTAGPSTPGMDRQQAFATDGMWSGLARTEAGMVSGWHHHGGYQTTIYVLTGALRMEFGPGGSNIVEAGPGDFVYVPKGCRAPGEQWLHGASQYRRGACWSGSVHEQRRPAGASLNSRCHELCSWADGGAG
jgi:mannose-6-phosphate isomerase-like protein (cupin superfamily)